MKWEFLPSSKHIKSLEATEELLSFGEKTQRNLADKIEFQISSFSIRSLLSLKYKIVSL